ncbi:MAG: TPM domain-containing protein [Chitinophagaceae bacterium]|nr:TPM domain-containing protein [Chitinophagaceae bacterium]
MIRFFSILLLLVSYCASAQMNDIISRRPSPPTLVNDFSKTLTTEQKEALERKLVAYDDSTSNQVAIVMVESLDGYSVEDAAFQILREWGVGSKKNNNGVVILVAIEERKIRIETGYGLERAIPDITAKSIIDQHVTPNFKAGNYYRGLDQAVDDIMKAAAGEYKAPEGYGKGIGKSIGAGVIIFLIILFIILGSAGGGRGGGGMMSRRGYGDFWTGWIIGSILSGGSKGGGGWSGGGGGWSGGGGGFGGFGGGSGGGGGASGSW